MSTPNEPDEAGPEGTANKSYAQVVGVKAHVGDYSNFGLPLYLNTQMSSSSGGTNTPISSCSSCHDLNVLDAEGVSNLSSNELRSKLKRYHYLLKSKKSNLSYLKTKFNDVRHVLEKFKKPDEKLAEFKQEMNEYREKANKLLNDKRRAQSDLSDLTQNTLYEFNQKYPDCKVAKLDHLSSKLVKLQQDEAMFKEKLESFENEMKNIGGTGRGNQRRNLNAQDSRAVNHIRTCKERLASIAKKRAELKGMIQRYHNSAENIKSCDSQYKENQAKITSLKEKSDPLLNAVDLRNKVEKLNQEIIRYEYEISLMNERKEHIFEQRRLSKLSLENDATPIKTGDVSSNVGYHQTQTRSKLKLEAAAQLLLTLKNNRDVNPKRHTVHHEFLSRLVDFGLDDEYLRNGPEPCVGFLEKYIKNCPLNSSPSKGDLNLRDSGMNKASSGEKLHNDKESGYRSLSTGDKTLNCVSDEIIDALSQHQATSVSANQLTEADTSSIGLFDSLSQAPQTSHADEALDEAEEERGEDKFSRTLEEQSLHRELAAVNLQRIPREPEAKALYVTDWINQGVAEGMGSSFDKAGGGGIRDAKKSDTSNNANKESAVDSTDFQNLEEYPPLKTAIEEE